MGDAVDQVLAQETVTGNEVLWLLQDNLGSVRETVKNDGTVNSRVDFDPFGNMISIIDPSSGGAATTLKTRLNFTGQEYDADLKLIWYSDGTGTGRWYDPATGTFISEDPLGFLAGDANLHRYVGNGATYLVDPSGMHEWAPLSWNEYWYYLTNPSEQDRDIRIGQGCAIGVAVLAGGSAAAGTEVTIYAEGCFRVLFRRFGTGIRRDPAHHAKPHGHWHFPWNW